MNITRENKKQKAIELMNQLGIYKPYIKGFEKNETICFFENYGGYWTYQEPELDKKIKDFEEEQDCLVYAVTHEFLEFGECYSFLYIPDYEEDWTYLLEKYNNNTFVISAYVWNKDVEYCSEFGSIGIQSAGGGIKRIM